MQLHSALFSSSCHQDVIIDIYEATLVLEETHLQRNIIIIISISICMNLRMYTSYLPAISAIDFSVITGLGIIIILLTRVCHCASQYFHVAALVALMFHALLHRVC